VVFALWSQFGRANIEGNSPVVKIFRQVIAHGHRIGGDIHRVRLVRAHFPGSAIGGEQGPDILGRVSWRDRLVAAPAMRPASEIEETGGAVTKGGTVLVNKIGTRLQRRCRMTVTDKHEVALAREDGLVVGVVLADQTEGDRRVPE
jgi:hypothetical protein